MKIGSLAKIVVMLLSISMLGCLPVSSNVVVGHVESAEYTATLSKRNSGAMSKGSTLVSVRAKGVPDDSTQGLIVLGVTGDKLIEMRWTGPYNLVLSCQPCAPQDVNFEAVRAGDITISYGETFRIR